MDALEFLRERKRMCNLCKHCEGCPLKRAGCGLGTSAPDEEYEKIIAAVEQWSKEHPLKTRQSVFLDAGGGVMERLTFDGNFCDIAQCWELPCPYNGACSQRKVWERLKAYEDTGLTPERCAEFARADAEGRYIVMRDAEQAGNARLRELAEADRDGRLVVLPCKVGTATYYIHYPIALYPDKSEPEIKRGIFTLPDLDRFGHYVFLTREEAEKALGAMKDE